jgi:hypothetical protein
MTNEEIIRRYATASVVVDVDVLDELRHPDWTVVWPQSGERVRSSEAFAEIVQRYPGGTPRAEVSRIVGSEDIWVVTPGNSPLRVAGSGDFWWGEWRMTYPDGAVYQCVDLMELRDRRIYRETVYWAAPFDAPDWRSPWVERSESTAP